MAGGPGEAEVEDAAEAAPDHFGAGWAVVFAGEVSAQKGDLVQEFAEGGWLDGGELVGGDGPAAAPSGFREDGFAVDVGVFATEHRDILYAPRDDFIKCECGGDATNGL